MDPIYKLCSKDLRNVGVHKRLMQTDAKNEKGVFPYPLTSEDTRRIVVRSIIRRVRDGVLVSTGTFCER